MGIPMGSAQPIVRWMHWLEALNFRLFPTLFLSSNQKSLQKVNMLVMPTSNALTGSFISHPKIGALVSPWVKVTLCQMTLCSECLVPICIQSESQTLPEVQCTEILVTTWNFPRRCSAHLYSSGYVSSIACG